MQTTFRHGSPLQVDYTPSGAAVAAGDVVVRGSVPQIAHRDIADGELGALAAFGGVYTGTAAGEITDGARVYWDDTNNKVTATASTHKTLGYALSAAAADGDEVTFLHFPHV